MKPNTNQAGRQAAVTLETRMIQEAAEHVHRAEEAMRSGCEHALLAGMRLIVLHEQTHSTGTRNDLVPRGTRLGFESALEKIGLSKTTAYRWMNAAGAYALQYMGIVAEDFPAPDAPEWQELELAIREQAGKMSLRRLVIGCNKVNSEDQRQEALIAMAEDGSDIAEAILDKIANGEMTLVQAMRAAAGAIATRDKERRDPQYLTMDGRTGELGGLYVKSLTTLTNAFAKWDDLPAPARAKARTLWLELVSSLPSDLL